MVINYKYVGQIKRNETRRFDKNKNRLQCFRKVQRNLSGEALVKLKDSICNIIIRQRTRLQTIVKYVTNTKRKQFSGTLPPQ